MDQNSDKQRRMEEIHQELTAIVQERVGSEVKRGTKYTQDIIK